MRPIHLGHAVLAAALLTAAAAPVHAQTPIRVGQTVSGELTASDPTVSASDKSHYKLYSIRGTAGQAIRVTMRSSAFDSFLTLGRSTGGTFTTLRFNDDGAGGNDSQIDFTYPADGEYLIRANSVSESTGAYTLQVEQGVPAGPVVNHAISMGQTVTGSLSDRSPQESDGTFYEQYTFTGQAGQTVQITQKSSDFDSYLSFGRLNGSTFESLKTDDDGAGGNDSKIVFTLPSSGTYAIHANSLSRASGSFTLMLEAGTPPAPVRSQSISMGQTVNGTLDSNDAKDTDDTYFDQYVFRGRSGQAVTITMKSTAFDSYLHFGRMADDSYSELKADDDGAGGNDSQVTFTLPSDGEYVIRANSLMAGAAGPYTLSLTSGPAGK
ncbi:MAG TPA: PPC domain-containing protein [Longimicrobiaceae bacterium]|nr:PPC domain-containing protein [Longimicrobiaceae bacterium]